MNSTYQLLDSGDFRKLERVGPFRFIRPAASAVWSPGLKPEEWQHDIAAEFLRHREGGGEWKISNSKAKAPFNITLEGLTLQMKLTSFGHLGLFAEQASNWRRFGEIIAPQVKGGRSFKVLNLFAYTGKHARLRSRRRRDRACRCFEGHGKMGPRKCARKRSRVASCPLARR